MDMLKTFMLQVILFFWVFLMSSCSGKDQQVNLPDNTIRGDESTALRKCRVVTDTSIIYTTAAGFKLEIPKWVFNMPLENTHGPSCELRKMKFHFAWIGGELVPISRPGLKPPEGYELPAEYEGLTLMMSFRDPSRDGTRREESYCRKKQPVYEYPGFHVVMCPNLAGADKSPNIRTLPFYPRFELMDGREVPTSFTCSHSEFDGYTVENVYDVEIRHSCRGYWRWRPGASAMFDLHEGKVIRKAYSVMNAAERVLNSWVLGEA